MTHLPPVLRSPVVRRKSTWPPEVPSHWTMHDKNAMSSLAVTAISRGTKLIGSSGFVKKNARFCRTRQTFDSAMKVEHQPIAGVKREDHPAVALADRFGPVLNNRANFAFS